jgi:predicted transcriptional regulator of viral defense system
MRGKEVRSHHALAKLARTQFGLVTTAQMRGLGYSTSAIGRAARAGRLHRLHRGVYLLGHRSVSPHARCLGAVLACGTGAVLSHSSASWLWGLQGWCPKPAEVSVPWQGHRRRDIRLHHTPALDETDRTTVEGISVTSVARTLLDIADRGDLNELERIVDRAKRRGVLDLAAVEQLLERLPASTASQTLLGALDLYREAVFDRAKSELLLLALAKKVGLPPPVLNCWVEKWEIDAYWEAERLAVEVDGWASHGSRKAFEEDRLRVEEMKLAGIDVVRISARRIEQRPDEVGARLKRLLAQRRLELGQ